MNRIPIVFAFDNNLVMPAAVCFYSLLVNANKDTSYDIFIIHHKDESLDLTLINRVLEEIPGHTLSLREIDDTFNASFQIRGITTPTYYRLLIPKIIPEYDKVLYSDVDVIFRDDLTDVYNTDLKDNYFGGVCALANLDDKLKHYYVGLGIDPSKVIYAGNLIINCREIRNTPGKIQEFIDLAQNNYVYQDLDVINLSSQGKIKYLSASYCVTTDISKASVYNRADLSRYWSKDQIDYAVSRGIVHYNGQKPWKGYCINFDIWWEYYRKSPIFDERFYYDFFYKKLEEYDRLPFLKRVKILARYFVYGRKN